MIICFLKSITRMSDYYIYITPFDTKLSLVRVNLMDIPCTQFQADLDSTFSKKGKSVVENPQRKVSLVSYEKVLYGERVSCFNYLFIFDERRN